MAGTVRQMQAHRDLEGRSRRGRSTVRSGSMALVVRDVLRDREGLIGRVVGHVLIEAGTDPCAADVTLVGIDCAGDTTVVERHGRVDLTPVQGGRRAERLDFAIDVSRRLTPAFVTPLGSRWWELRASVGGSRPEAVRHELVVPDVRRVVRVANEPAPPPPVVNVIARLPAPLRPTSFAFDPTSEASGRARVRSRGDWGIVDVPDSGRHEWQASVLLYEHHELGRRQGRTDEEHRSELVYSRSLETGPNTLEFELPRAIPPSHIGPLLTTFYELRVHTTDGRRLGARHVVSVLQ